MAENTADWLEKGADDLLEDGLPHIAGVHRVLAAALRALEDQSLMLDSLETVCVGLAPPDREAAEYFIEQIAAPARALLAQADALRAAHERGEGTG